MEAAACLTLAVVHLVVWSHHRKGLANLFFALLSISVACVAAFELCMMRAQTTAQFGTLLRWAHVPVFFSVVSIVGFVRVYFWDGPPVIRLDRMWPAAGHARH